MTRPTASRSRFQTFWYGGPLTSYERFCLQSFLDHGHEVDLYTYDPHLVVPAGVVVCDAAQVVPHDDVFVYQHEGFGKGSVSAFSNVFRYQLLTDRGGWWIDTDVVCLTSEIDDNAGQYFAREDDEKVAPGTMCLTAGSPVAARCLERVVALGRDVRWGDGGPRTFTDVLKELGLFDRAAPPAECYPVHYSEAVDMLRPSRANELGQRLSSAMFLHVWNSTLVHAGVDKHLLPPVGSLLRMIADRHPVEGWLGEYDEHRLERDMSLTAEVHSLTADVASLERDRTQLLSAQSALSAERDAVKRQLDEVTGSISWRLTRPLRRAARYWNRRRRDR
ncbi:MAG: hypothetical protein Q7V57_04980 [Actinomycetota bacterium]|nr:hypothetical protein [Actinomycetota bacterium]